MKELIKIRVWDEFDKSYWDDNLIKTNAGWLLFPDNRNHEDLSVERYTGLKDKYGKHIYEGDYLEVRNSSGTVWMRVEVFFSKGSFMIGDPDKMNNYLRILEDEGWEYQIIGNINESEE